jgi:hypothetical protein
VKGSTRCIVEPEKKKKGLDRNELKRKEKRILKLKSMPRFTKYVWWNQFDSYFKYWISCLS